MHIIDRYAYANDIRRIDPAHKAGLALLVVCLCLLLQRPAVGLLATGWMWLLAAFWAGLPGRAFGRVLLAETGFLLLATLGIALSLSSARPVGMDWSWRFGPLWLSSSWPLLEQTLLLVARALGAAAAMNFLAMTTPLVDLVDLMRRWRLPPLLIDLMTLIYRFIFVLLESLGRMYIAQASRLGYAGLRRGMVSAGLLSSRLFIETYQRSRRLQLALDSRAFNGELRVLPARYQSDARTAWIGAAVGLSLLLAWMVR
jgi:cobalt/nickel transport system permease protein